MHNRIAAALLALATFISPAALADAVGDNGMPVEHVPKFFINTQFRGTYGLIPPVGSTANRSSSPVAGQFRYNSDDNRPETYDGSAWIQQTKILYSNFGTVATAANTTETTGMTYTIPANTLLRGKVRVKWWGKTAATSNNKTVQLYLGGSSQFTTGAVASNNKTWSAEMVIAHTGSSAQKLFITGSYNATPVNSSNIVTTSLTDTGTLVVKNTMTNGTAAASDITTEGMLVEFLGSD